MASEKKFNLSLRIRALDGFSGTLKKAQSQIDQLTSPVRALSAQLRDVGRDLGLPRVADSARNLGTAFGNIRAEGLKLAAFTGVAAYGLFRITKGAIDAGDELGEMSQRVGLSVDAFASLRHAAAQADVSQEDFNASLDQFNKRLGEAKAGGGSLLAFLKKTGPGLAAQIKGAKSTEEALSFMTDALHRIEDPQRRAALAQAAFGRSGLQMGQFLGQGSKAIQEQQRRYIELAGSQAEFARVSGEADNALRDSEVAFTGLRSAIAVGLLPAITDLAKGVTSFLGENREGITQWAREAGGEIKAWVDGGGLKRLSESLRDIASAVKWVVAGLGGLKNAGIALAVVWNGPLLMALGQGAAGFAKLGWSVGSFLGKATGLTGWATNWLNYLWMMRGSIMTGLLPSLKALGVSVTATLGKFVVAAAPFAAFAVAAAAVTAAGYAIYKGWEPLKELFSDIRQVWVALAEMAGSPLQAIKNSAQWFGKELGLVEKQRAPRELVGTAAQRAAAAAQAGQAQVTVDFQNAPPGTRVTPARGNTAPLEIGLSTGPALAFP